MAGPWEIEQVACPHLPQFVGRRGVGLDNSRNPVERVLKRGGSRSIRQSQDGLHRGIAEVILNAEIDCQFTQFCDDGGRLVGIPAWPIPRTPLVPLKVVEVSELALKLKQQLSRCIVRDKAQNHQGMKDQPKGGIWDHLVLSESIIVDHGLEDRQAFVGARDTRVDHFTGHAVLVTDDQCDQVGGAQGGQCFVRIYR